MCGLFEFESDQSHRSIQAGRFKEFWKSHRPHPGQAATLLLLWLTTPDSATAQFLTQTVQLQPGWNAVLLEVDPPDRSPAVVFAGLPTLGVWTWSERISATDFIQDPSGVGWNHAQWLSFFSPGTPQDNTNLAYGHSVLKL